MKLTYRNISHGLLAYSACYHQELDHHRDSLQWRTAITNTRLQVKSISKHTSSESIGGFWGVKWKESSWLLLDDYLISKQWQRMRIGSQRNEINAICLRWTCSILTPAKAARWEDKALVGFKICFEKLELFEHMMRNMMQVRVWRWEEVEV